MDEVELKIFSQNRANATSSGNTGKATGVIRNLTDTQLFELCEKYGTQARIWRQKFAGLLPEVYRRKLYFQKGFGSIFEFAKKLAGMSEEQVRRVLNLEKKFEHIPILKSLLENGEVSINKLARVASIATAENQEVLAAQVKLLPKAALETFVRDEKYFQEKITERKPFVPGHTNPQQSLQNANGQSGSSISTGDFHATELWLSPEVTSKLIELQKKGININKIILEALQTREIEIAQEKEKLSAKLAQIGAAQSRHIPVKVQMLLKKEHGTKCSITNCNKDSEEIHHAQRFSIGRSHDPKFLAPLCKQHHIIAHSVDQKFHQRRSSA